MDDNEVLTATLNATLQRHSRTVQNYEVEIANLTAEIVRLQAKVSELQGAAEAAKTPEVKPK
jgi:peptidoglycan hydrolase CwlO-like protein